MFKLITGILTKYGNQNADAYSELNKYIQSNPKGAIEDMFVVIASTKRTECKDYVLQAIKDFVGIIKSNEHYANLFMKHPDYEGIRWQLCVLGVL